MSVEYIPFDPSLIGKKEIIIWCTEAERYGELASLLEAHGVSWASGARPTEWSGWDGHHNARYIDRYKEMLRAPIRFYEGGRGYCGLTFMKYPPEQGMAVYVGDLI